MDFRKQKLSIEEVKATDMVNCLSSIGYKPAIKTVLMKWLCFEGFFDFLSFKTVCKNLTVSNLDVVVLNTLSFFEKARPFMENHRSICLYLDRDTAGQNCSQRALALSPNYSDESQVYNHYKDFNEWLMQTGKLMRKHT